MSRRDDEFIEAFRKGFADAQAFDDDEPLITLLESSGFLYGGRSATNLRLVAFIVPEELLLRFVETARLAPVPDMALNNLERLSSIVPKQELLSVCTSQVRVRQLLNICGSSPFLVGILCRDPSYFHDLFVRKAIDSSLGEAKMLATLKAMVQPETGYPELLPLLRRFKYSQILRIAARDLNDLASLEEVTAELSALACAALQVAYEVVRRTLVNEHGVPLARTADGDFEADLAVIGMGKLGGRELNFSSDIDILYFYSTDQGETTGIDDGRGGLTGVVALRTFFTRMAERISKALAQVTEDGYVFRVDLGLRPEGKSGDIAVSLRAAEIYYESWGQPWERTAMLKARPIAGSEAVGVQFLRSMEPFVYRRYLDYTLIEDMMAMKNRINASLAREREGDYNIKLGRGGIREIEFFVQALQLVYVGKNPGLREKNTLLAIDKLADNRIISEEDRHILREAYRFLRTVEHRIQVVQERQTHNLPKSETEMQALARRCGFLRQNGLERFTILLNQHRDNVSAIYHGLFHGHDRDSSGEVAPETYTLFDHKADPDLIKDMLAERGFGNVDRAYENLITLREGPARIRLTERGRRILEKIAPLLLQEIIASPDPDLALTNLCRFFASVGPRTSFYALLAENREIQKLLVSLFSMSEFLSKIFISHPEHLDALVSRMNSSAFKDRQLMEIELRGLLREADDFEERLDVLRRYRNEGFLRIGMNDIYGKLGQTEIVEQLTYLADACLSAAYMLARQELTRFGNPCYVAIDGTQQEASLAIVAMGKLGGEELNYHSDLDIIYVYDHQGMTDGEKRISNHEYFAKLGQKIISILTTTTREGYVYKIDTRLRPSGNAGPLVTSMDSYRSYHEHEAQIWERQALTKARVVLGTEELGSAINDINRHTVFGTGADESVRKEIHRLRMRMENELAREKAGSYNIKTGRGGLVDVEFAVQFLQLCHGKHYPEIRSANTLTALKSLHACALLPDEDYEVLFKGYKFLRRLENRLRLIHDYSINDLGGSRAYLNMLARRLGYDEKLRNPGDALMADYAVITQAVRSCYDRIFCVGGEEDGACLLP